MRCARVVFAAVLAAVSWGCGSSGGDGDEIVTPTCTPATCQSLGATCGQAGDGCGSVLECGGCPDGQTCGGGGVVNACGTPACQPATCQALGASCGAVADGCGGQLECGGCPQGQSCGGGGTPNVCATPQATCTPTTCAAQGKTCGTIEDGCGATLDCGACGDAQVCTADRTCGPAPCTPTTCAAEGKDCGTVEDGCGGTLECGSCPAGQTCGGAGNQNVCGVPAPGSEVLWYALRSTPGPDEVIAAGVDGEGNRLLLSTTRHAPASGGTLSLEKRDRAGKPLWTRSWEFKGYPVFRMAVTRLGNVLLAVDSQCWSCSSSLDLDLGGGALADSGLVKLGPDGRFVWQVQHPGQAIRAIATDDAGSALIVRWPRVGQGNSVWKYAWDGKLLWSEDTGWVEAAALAPSGEVYLAGRGTGTNGMDPLVSGATPPSVRWGTQLVKLGTDGTYQWSVHAEALGYVSAVQTTAKGTMVLLADRIGTLTWGDSRVDNGGLALAVIERDGRPRFARGIERLWPALLAVDPTGRAVVGGSTSCAAVTLRAFDLANTPLWTRTVPADGSCGSATYARALAYGADHEVTVGLTFSGTLTVAGDRLVPQGEDGLALQLAP